MAEVQRVYGLHAVRALFRQDDVQVLRAWAQEGRDDPRLAEVVGLLEARGIQVERVPRRELDRRLDGARHQEIGRASCREKV